MARAIDGEVYMELLKEQYLHHEAMGNKQMAKAWQGAMQLLYDMPTLTPPNEIPPCYQPDGDGCAYQCYDGDDEPIEKCKECPLCYSDKQRHYTPPNEPLTLEQLRKMDGQPVWIVESPDWGHWELSEDAEDYLCDRDTDLYGLTYPDPDGKAGLHKLGWVAYAYPPVHIGLEGWTAEWVSNGNRFVCSRCGVRCAKESDETDYYPLLSAFCPSCGRAMTPEAWAELEKRMGVR